MDPSSWHLTIVTPGKVYKGTIQSDKAIEKRTISLLNSAATPGLDVRLNFDGYVKIDNASVIIKKNEQKYESILIKKTDIIFAYDEFETMGSYAKRVRYESWKHPRDQVKLSILTTQKAGMIFKLTGVIIRPWEKINSKDPFVPMTSVLIEKFLPKENGRLKRMTDVPFVALNKNYLEAISLVPLEQNDATKRQQRANDQNRPSPTTSS